MTRQPRHLVIVGAGPVGVEMAQAFRRLGSEVTVIAAGSEILPKDDQELASMLREYLQSEGVRFELNARAVSASDAGPSVSVALSTGKTVEGDAILAAIGRKIDTRSLQLERAGVQASDKGVIVDRHCRTSCRHIYAVGDVTGRQPFTHMAEHMAKVAVTNCILRWPASLEKTIPWCSFTSPELAHTGLATDGDDPSGSTILKYPFRHLDRAVLAGETEGLVKVRVDRRGRVLGASILGAGAGELINTWSLAARKGMRVQDISATIHPYPTLSLANRKAADAWDEKWLDSSLLRILGRLLGYRGVHRGSSALKK
jgi:pyruvate/2-oxoglutarate dehydrogenase complex dihydrolipoamide dehydrogenase (E3) component